MKKKIIIFGCQQIALDFIRFIIGKDDIEISLVITYELQLDKTYGYESVLEESTKLGLEVISPARITKTLIDRIKLIKPHMIFSVYYRKILPVSLLKIPQFGCVNIHPSLLPFYRGPVPTAWAIQNGERFFGLTIHYMDEGIDTGEILVQEKHQIYDEETGFELYTRGMTLGAKLLGVNFDSIINQKLTPVSQKHLGSYYGKKDGQYRIIWKNKTEDIRNMIRVHAKPYNPAETKLFNRYILINRAEAIYNTKYALQGAGKIIDVVEGDKLIVSCADGFLKLIDYEVFPKLTLEEKKIYFKLGNQFD
jgi:methionyl-tRNA formyltransferase